MISRIGINPFQASSAVGAGRDASAPNSRSDKSTENKNARPATDSVLVKPANIGGSSAIAAQSEASRPAAEKDATTKSEKSSDDKDAAGLSEEERAQVKKLAARDREVRAHEAAHQAVGGQYAGAASFSFESGPDGRRYAVGGEVPIDIGAVSGDPDATIRKLRTVRRAALAPAEPSAQDRSVAATAGAGVREAQADKRALATEERKQADEASEQGQSNGSAQSGISAPGKGAQPDLVADRPITPGIRTDIQV